MTGALTLLARVDYNQALTVQEAMRRIDALSTEGVAWVEEPTVREDLRRFAEIRRQGASSIQLGENWCGPADMQSALDADACDLAVPI